LDIKTFSIYSQAAELVNGIILHAIVGRRAAPIDNNGTNQQPLHERRRPYSIPVYYADHLSIAHFIVTPTLLLGIRQLYLLR